MSCCLPSEIAAAMPRRTDYSARNCVSRIVEYIRTARDRRRQCQELLDYLASDHRAASDLGITSHEARSLWRRRLPPT